MSFKHDVLDTLSRAVVFLLLLDVSVREEGLVTLLHLPIGPLKHSS